MKTSILALLLAGTALSTACSDIGRSRALDNPQVSATTLARRCARTAMA